MNNSRQNLKENELASSRFPKIDPKMLSNSLFLTAKSSFSNKLMQKSQSNLPENCKNLKKTTLFSWKKGSSSSNFHGSRFLDDKILTDKLFLEVEPARKARKINKDREETAKNLKIKALRNKNEKLLVNEREFTINDSIEENYLKNLLNPDSEIIHFEEFLLIFVQNLY